VPTFRVTVNGRSRPITAWAPDEPLLYALRGSLGLTGAKPGCGLGQCGSCTVLVDDQPTRACTVPVSAAAGRRITTIEGLGTREKPDKLQAAFIAEQAAQCGYCTSGMIMSARALLLKTPHPTDTQVKEALAGNLCRCGAYTRILRAVLRASKSNPKLQAPNPNHSQPSTNPKLQAPNPKDVRLAESDWSLEVGSGWSLGFGAWDLTRRHFLGGAALFVSFAFAAREAGAQPARQLDAPRAPLDAQQVDSFLAIHPDGAITIYTSKVDVGTGMRIAIAQMAAEELGVPVGRITVVDGDTGQCPNSGGTGGSTGVTRGGTAVRQAAATARLALLRLGAERLKTPIADLTIADGVVRRRTAGRGVGIGGLVRGQRLMVAVDPAAPLAAPSTYTVVGTSPLRPDVPAKCRGRYTYIQDFSVPGMLHARVIRPPAVGARLTSVDESSVSSLPDVRVVRLDSFLAVVASHEWAAVRAASALKSAWTEARELPGHDRLEPYLRAGVVDRDQTFVDRGRVNEALAGAAKTLTASYFWPCQSHASLGPSCAVADVRADRATVWTSSQVTYGLRATLARVFGLPAETMRVIFVEGSGSYGTNGADHAAADALLLSKTLRRPVRVQWSRQDEHAWDPKGPQQLLDLRASLDAGGRLTGWQTEMWIPTNRRGARILLAADAAGIPQDSGRDAAAIYENGDPSYAIDHVRVVAHWLRDTPLNPSNLRAPGKPANVFAVESFTDEIAAAVNVDPLAFRRQRLADPRALEALSRAADAFGWQPRPSPNPRRAQGGRLVGQGMAYVRYKQAENYVATFMEVAVDPASGEIAVARVVCAHDGGLVVNPDALKNQIEGAIAQTLSRALHEEVQFDTARVTSVDWASYPILRFPELPAIEVILIERRDQPPWGAGEAATVPVAAALGNAFFDATGVRLRRVPFTRARVRDALYTRS
jgi:CO/xanthine dehydrogenase Mo-binding subunit/aerobic-type carbon monoxide dehydrogenase small subunit (CoxS/CutS family)